MAVHGCVRALTTAVVAVMVAVRDTSGRSASGAGVESGLPTWPEDGNEADEPGDDEVAAVAGGGLVLENRGPVT